MGLIKSTSSPATRPFSIGDIEAHARGILLRARQQADGLLQAAQVEGEFLRQTARKDGHEQGHREGLAQGIEAGRQAGYEQALAEHQAALTAAVGALTAVAAELNGSRLRLEGEGLAEVVALAAAIARRVTKRQAAVDPDVLAANVREAMTLVVRSADVRVAIHPAQRATLAEALPRLRLDFPQLEHVAVVDDPSLAPGGCRIYCRDGEVHADIDGQLDRVIGELGISPPGGAQHPERNPQGEVEGSGTG